MCYKTGRIDTRDFTVSIIAIGWKTCEWSKFQRTGVRLYDVAMEVTQMVLALVIGFCQDISLRMKNVSQKFYTKWPNPAKQGKELTCL